jgi:hypothetical protein
MVREIGFVGCLAVDAEVVARDVEPLQPCRVLSLRLSTSAMASVAALSP